MKTAETYTSRLEVDNQDVVHMYFKFDEVDVAKESNLAEAKLIYQARTTLTTKNPKQLLLIHLDTTSMGATDAETRAYAKSDDVNSITKAMALVVKNRFTLMIGNFFTGIDKGDYPVKLFMEEDVAIAWLKSHE